MRYDDFSCNPRRWSPGKLSREKRGGMPAVMAEIERRNNPEIFRRYVVNHNPATDAERMSGDHYSEGTLAELRELFGIKRQGEDALRSYCESRGYILYREA